MYKVESENLEMLVAVGVTVYLATLWAALSVATRGWALTVRRARDMYAGRWRKAKAKPQ